MLAHTVIDKYNFLLINSENDSATNIYINIWSKRAVLNYWLENVFKGQVTCRRRVTVDRRYTGRGWAHVCRWRELTSERYRGQCRHAFSAGTPEPMHREGNWVLSRTVQVTLTSQLLVVILVLFVSAIEVQVLLFLGFTNELNNREVKWRGVSLTDGRFLPAPRGGILLWDAEVLSSKLLETIFVFHSITSKKCLLVPVSFPLTITAFSVYLPSSWPFCNSPLFTVSGYWLASDVCVEMREHLVQTHNATGVHKKPQNCCSQVFSLEGVTAKRRCIRGANE